MVYVTNTGSNNVTVINGINNSVVATVSAGSGPFAIVAESATNKAYVINIAGDALTVIDGKTLTATPLVTPVKQ
jgi:YVTN family beta-propeller protein